MSNMVRRYCKGIKPEMKSQVSTWFIRNLIVIVKLERKKAVFYFLLQLFQTLEIL